MTVVPAERLADVLELERHAARRPRHLEPDVGALDVRPREVAGLQPLDFLAPRLHLAGPRAGRKARDEVVELRDLLLALRVVGLEPRADLRLGQHHVVVPAGVRDDGLVVDVRDVRAHLVEEVAVVRDHDQRAVVLDEELAQPVDRVEVQVVGRLVQQQRLRVAEQRLRQQHAHLLSALDLRHLARVQLVGDVEALQQDRGVAFGRVAVLLADDAFELAEAHAVGLGHLGLGVEELALFERAPQALVPHDDRVDHAELVEGELVLPQDAELGRAARPCPSAAGNSPVSSFMKVDLPEPLGPVRP